MLLPPSERWIGSHSGLLLARQTARGKPSGTGIFWTAWGVHFPASRPRKALVDAFLGAKSGVLGPPPWWVFEIVKEWNQEWRLNALMDK